MFDRVLKALLSMIPFIKLTNGGKLYSKLQNTPLKFTCSMLTIETLEKVSNMFKVNNKNTGVFIGNFQNIFTPFPSVPTVHFEQVNVSYNHLQKNFRQTLVFMSISALREKFNFFFHKIFASTVKIFISGGGISTRQ